VIRRLGLLGCAILIATAVPAWADTSQRMAEAAPSPADLHLMNDTEFSVFLKDLDSRILSWKRQLRQVDVGSLDLNTSETRELQRGYAQCLQSMDDTREEIQKLAQKQTLKLDFLLLVDLNDLTRSLDSFNRDLVDPLGPEASASARRSLGYAKTVYQIDAALAPHVVEFQHHVLAFTGLVDAAMAQQGTNPPGGQK
jgi:hypothetical protein